MGRKRLDASPPRRRRDLTDAQVLDQFEFNLQWHYALGVEPDQAHVCQKTLHNYRVRLMANERARLAFESLTRGLVELDGLDVGRQRLDSTHVTSGTDRIAVQSLPWRRPDVGSGPSREPSVPEPTAVPCRHSPQPPRRGTSSSAPHPQPLSPAGRGEQRATRRPCPQPGLCGFEAHSDRCLISNIATWTRLGVFTETTTKFLRELRGQSPDKLAQLDGGYAERYLDREGYFADATREQARRRLPMMAVDVYRLVQAFAQDEVVSQWESYRLLERLFEEQCEVVEEPEAGATPVKLVDDPPAPCEAAVQPAAGDEPAVAPAQESGAPTSAKPALDSGDAPPSDEAGTGSRSAGADEAGGGREAETAAGEEPGVAPAVATPTAGPAGTGTDAGQESGDWAEGQALCAQLSAEVCSACPLASTCPTRSKKSGERTLRCRKATAATARRQAEQREPAFKERYKKRSGVESTNAELKGPHGADDLRVRVGPRVEVSLRLKAMALNAKRAVRYHAARLREAAEVGPEPAAVGA